MKTKILTAICVLTCQVISAQCPFDPTVTGDTLLCPNQNGTLTTQVYDSYQWYKKPFSGTPQPVPGATSQTLSIDYFNDAGYFFSVEATDNGCTEMSPEVLVDGYVFLLPVVQTTGDFTIGPNGETIICEGDTAYFTLLQPYDTNITWFNNGSPIAGATSTVFTVTDSGFYTVQGAPSLCPNFIQQLGVTLEVVVINCGTGIPENNLSLVKCYPNPANEFIYLENIYLKNRIFNLYSTDGRLMLSRKLSSGNGIIRVDTGDIPSGLYLYELRFDDSISVKKKISITR